PEMYRATVSAGEQSGHLEQVLEQLADYLETRHDTGRSVAQAMIYPAFIMVFASVVIMLMMTFVVPKLVAVFEGTDQTLPMLTRIVMALSDFTRDWGWLVV
ncbi:MAG: type II secretion system protein GspF, partial [Anaerolineae bacterium]|nr:type II secretion system protein GspF [Anaerolineae bacterium]